MQIINKKIKNLICLALILSGILVFSTKTKAADNTVKCEKATVNLVVKNYNQDVLYNLPFTIFEQVETADGRIAKGRAVANGTTDKNSGMGTVKFVPKSDGYYALRIKNPNLNSSADFLYFNDFSITCGEEISIVRYLTSVNFIPRDYYNLAQKGVSVGVYTQNADANGENILEYYLGSLNTGNTGQAMIYLPSLENSAIKFSGNYALKIKSSKGIYYEYNILPDDQRFSIKNVINNLGSLSVSLKDLNGNPVPNVKLDIYEEKRGNNLYVGRYISSAKTDNYGVAFVDYVYGKYMVQYKDKDGVIYTYGPYEINKENRNILNLTAYSENGVGQCSNNVGLSLYLRNFDKKLISNLNSYLYEQEHDADQNIIPGKLMKNGKSDSYGYTQLNFKPVPGKRYILKVCDNRTNSNDDACFWYYNITFSCEKNVKLEKTLSSVSLSLKDSNNKFLANNKFSVYLKEKDDNGNFVLSKNNFIGNFTVGANGKTNLYLPYRNPLNNDKITEYVLVYNKNKDNKLIKVFALNVNKPTSLSYKLEKVKVAVKTIVKDKVAKK